jgi:hypothetical protein
MNMLTHTRHPLGRLEHLSDAPGHAQSPGAAHVGAVKRIFAAAVSILVAMAAVAGVIALKSVHYLSHFSY